MEKLPNPENELKVLSRFHFKDVIYIVLLIALFVVAFVDKSLLSFELDNKAEIALRGFVASLIILISFVNLLFYLFSEPTQTLRSYLRYQIQQDEPATVFLIVAGLLACTSLGVNGFIFLLYV